MEVVAEAILKTKAKNENIFSNFIHPGRQRRKAGIVEIYLQIFMTIKKHSVDRQLSAWYFFGAPGRIRTCGTRIRNPELYPPELLER